MHFSFRSEIGGGGGSKWLGRGNGVGDFLAVQFYSILCSHCSKLGQLVRTVSTGGMAFYRERGGGGGDPRGNVSPETEQVCQGRRLCICRQEEFFRD